MESVERRAADKIFLVPPPTPWTIQKIKDIGSGELWQRKWLMRLLQMPWIPCPVGLTAHRVRTLLPTQEADLYQASLQIPP